MERSLNQDGIDALFRKARGLQSGATHRQRELARCDFRQAGQITREQARAVGGLHESFARNLGHTLGAYLRCQLEVGVVAIEQRSFGECAQRLPEISFVASLGVRPQGVSAGLQMDLSLAYPMIDLMLGGNGSAAAHGEDLTEIEEQVLESIVVLVTRELQAAWQPVLDLIFEFERRQPMAQILRLMPPNEKVLSLSFELQVAQVRGMFSLVLPAVVSTALLRQLSDAWVYHRRQEDPDVRPRLRRRLHGARFGGRQMLLHDVMELAPGSVLELDRHIDDPVELLVGGKIIAWGDAVVVDGNYGLRVGRLVHRRERMAALEAVR